jgi:hypothetical protein
MFTGMQANERVCLPVIEGEAHLVWPVVASAAATDLGFPEEIIVYYRTADG